MSNLELSANVLTVLCIWLAGRSSTYTWPVGIVASVLFGILFYDVKLYADAILQVFFVGTSLYGWLHWSNSNEIKELTSEELVTYSVGGIVGTALYDLMLHSFTDAYAPVFDSAVLAFSIIGQLLLMSRYKASWGFWIIVNTISVPLFYSRGLYLTSALYAAYWIHACYTAYSWNKRFVKQESYLD